LEQRTRGSSSFKAEGGHAVGREVAVEHQGTGVHPWVAMAWPEVVHGISAMCAGRPAVAAVPTMVNDAARKEAAWMENDEVGLLVVLVRVGKPGARKATAIAALP